MARVTVEMASGLAGRLADLRAKLASRQDKPGYTRNARHLRGEIARLEQESRHG